MESEVEEKRKPNPRRTANLLSKLTFWYTRKLFIKGFKKELEEEDLYDVLPEYEICRVGERIEEEWNLQKHHKNHAMLLVFWKMFGIRYCLLWLAMLISVIISIIRPIFLGKLVYYFTPGQTDLSKRDAYLYSFVLMGANVIGVICRQNYYFQVEALAINVRTAICSLLYRKFLKLPAYRLKYVSFGEIANLITRDVNIFDQFFNNFTHTWSGIIIGIISCYNLYQRIGLPAVVVILAFVIFILFQVYVGICINKLKRATSNKTDKRIITTQDVLSNIQTTKMYGWEEYLKGKITESRREEMTILFKLYSVFFATISSGLIVYNLSYYFVMMTCFWLGQTLTAEIIYFIMGIFYGILQNFLVGLPYGTFTFAQVIASIKRMQNIIDILDEETEISFKTHNSGRPKIQLHNITIKAQEKIILENINFNLRKGLTLLIGPASSGKSVLLMAILKEFPLFKGQIVSEGKISYASQEPWLFPSTIRQNIIFGSKYEEKRYRDVIKACALEQDFDMLQQGDGTIVADRGSNLSKGQRCRISLARSIYKKCDIYLFDDCLSSVDTLVARHIFVNCMLKFLNDKIILLVTNNANLTKYAACVCEIEHFTLRFTENSVVEKIEPAPEPKEIKEKILKFLKSEEEENLGLTSKLITVVKDNKIYGEKKQSGSVSSETYKVCIRLGGGVLYCLMLLFIYILTQMSVSYKDKFISEWSNLEDQISRTNITTETNSKYVFLTKERNNVIYNYTSAAIGECMGTIIRAIALFFFSKRISQNLHKKMIDALLNAPLNFFNRNFIGNIVNRFSKDLVTFDENIPLSFLHITAIVFETIGNFLLISSTDSKFLISIVVLFVSFIFLRCVYLRTGRSLKRLEATMKSPVIGYFNATLEGLLSIKVFRAEKCVKEEFERHHNLYNSASFLHLSCQKAYVFAVDFFVGIFVAIVIFQFLIFDEGVAPGDVGMAVSQAFAMGFVFFFALQKGAELETQMTSVERALEYTNIKHEIKTGLEIENWPKEPEIVYRNVYLSMDDSNSYVLKNINFAIKPMEKIGIVGRTGAGKSSLISTLFRLYEPEGKIMINGVDIKTLSLKFLRSKISVIPQDPMLFDGTVRENLDPDNLQTDVKIWKALKIVKLKKLISCLETNIKSLNLTCSQKQLFCLARVLLKNNKILILDEIVENLDCETEILIYNIIKDYFGSCTVITIAHKLEFVKSYDKILVLESGEIVEYNNPDILLQNKNGLFYKMFHGNTALPTRTKLM